MRRGALFVLLAIAVLYFWGDINPQRSAPATAPVTKIAAQPRPTADDLAQGRHIFDTWRDAATKSSVSLKEVIRVISNLEKVSKSDPLHTTAQEAVAVLAPIRHDLEETANREAATIKAKKDAAELRATRDLVVVRQLRAGMNNPESFQLEEALRMDDGTLCVAYRARNGFNAVMAGRAVIDAKRIVTSDDRDRFSGMWNRLCANKSGVDMTYLRRLL
jgi:hypothetical protein